MASPGTLTNMAIVFWLLQRKDRRAVGALADATRTRS
jgi:hypothetical protein